MKQIEKLIEHIVKRVNINLSALEFDVSLYTNRILPITQLIKFYAFYGLTSFHPLSFYFKYSSLAGSYFLGKIDVYRSILYKTDVRGDELKKKGIIFKYKEFEIPVLHNERITIKDSFLIKTLIHNNSHNPENPEDFFIYNTISTHYANIHGSTIKGCFIEPFATVDLTTANDSVIGAFSYVQAEEISGMNVEPGTVWIRYEGLFNFYYRFPETLKEYIDFKSGTIPTGILMDFVAERKQNFEKVFNTLNLEIPIDVPDSTSLDRYAVVDSKTHISENVLIAQRAYLENCWLGKGANAQENCYIINSRLEGNNITAHGAKIINTHLEKDVFVGFNSFIRGALNDPFNIGKNSIIMPHTIIDLKEPASIPEGCLVWGLIKSKKDIKKNSIAIKDFYRINGYRIIGNMLFEGSGSIFIDAFRHRIEHILEENGAFFDGRSQQGHAQKNRNIAISTIQPYFDGEKKGLCPTISIK